MIEPHELVIDDDNYQEFLEENTDGQYGYGAIMRDYNAHPVGSYGKVEPFSMDLIPVEEWSSRIRDMEQSKSRLSDIVNTGNNGLPIPNLDQGDQGYCWAHSPVSAMIACRARDMQPYVRLSAYAPACIIKNYRNQGGWNPQALEFLIERGCPSVDTWPEKSKNPANDRPETWADAANYKITEGWMDLNPPVYDRNLSFRQLMTCLLSRIPCPVDLAWWGHSVCALDPVEVDSSLQLTDIRRWGVRQWNSWAGWGDNGMAVLRGTKAEPDGATACKGVTLSA